MRWSDGARARGVRRNSPCPEALFRTVARGARPAPELHPPRETNIRRLQCSRRDIDAATGAPLPLLAVAQTTLPWGGSDGPAAGRLHACYISSVPTPFPRACPDLVAFPWSFRVLSTRNLGRAGTHRGCGHTASRKLMKRGRPHAAGGRRGSCGCAAESAVCFFKIAAPVWLCYRILQNLFPLTGPDFLRPGGIFVLLGGKFWKG